MSLGIDGAALPSAKAIPLRRWPRACAPSASVRWRASPGPWSAEADLDGNLYVLSDLRAHARLELSWPQAIAALLRHRAFQTPARARANVRSHYDIPQRALDLYLDRAYRAYSCGMFAAPERLERAELVRPGAGRGDGFDSLEQAQWRKFQDAIDFVAPAAGDAILAEWVQPTMRRKRALTFFLANEPLYVQSIARVLSAGDGELLVGGPRQDGASPPRFFNSVFRLDAAGQLGRPYDKQHLVPFTEYPPLARLDLVRRRFEGVRFFSHGAPSPPLPTRAGPAGILLCNEAMLPELAGQRAREGAAFLAVPSNDTWIASRSFAEPLFDIVRMRAIEQRRWLVRASTSGPSAIVDPWGRVQARSEPFRRAVVTGWIRPVRELSPYARFGDAFAFACAAALPLALWRARRPTQPRGASRGASPATR